MHLLLFAETIQLFPDGTIFLHIALILFMIWVLNRTLYRPINRIIESREKNKGGKSGEAVGILKDVEAKEALYGSELLAARSKSYEFIEKEQKMALASREEQLSTAKAEVEEKFETGKADFAAHAAEARTSISTEAEKMADRIAANILKA